MVFCFSLSDCCRDIWPRRWPRKALSRLCRLLTVWMWKASRTRSPPDRLSASWRPGIAAAEGGQARRPSLISTVMHTVCKQSQIKFITIVTDFRHAAAWTTCSSIAPGAMWRSNTGRETMARETGARECAAMRRRGRSAGVSRPVTRACGQLPNTPSINDGGRAGVRGRPML